MKSIYDIPAGLPEHDVELIRKAFRQRWEDIEPEAALTETARDRLEDIAQSKYHREESRNY